MSPPSVRDSKTRNEDKRVAKTKIIETTVGEVAEDLRRRGLDPHDRITVTVLSDELIPGRRLARARVIAAGLSDDDIDRLIEVARLAEEVVGRPLPGHVMRGGTLTAAKQRANA